MMQGWPPDTPEPAAVIVEPPTSEPALPEPADTPANGDNDALAPAGGFSPTGFQTGIIILAFLLVLLGAVAGVVLVRRARSSG